MVTRSFYIVLLAAVTIAGCNPGIVDVEPFRLNNLKTYFWGMENTSIKYDQLVMPDSVVYHWDAKISPQLDNSASVKFIRSDNRAEQSFSFLYNADRSITIDNILSGTVFSLPEGFSLEMNIETKITPYKIRKVLALDQNTLVALTTEGKVFGTTNRGISWQAAEFNNSDSFEVSEIVKTAGASRFNIYLSTPSGTIYKSENGLSWIKAASFENPIRTFAVSREGVIFAAVANSKTVLYTKVNVPQPITIQAPGIVTQIAFSHTSLNDSSKVIFGIEGKGLYYSLFYQAKNIIPSKDAEKLTADFSFQTVADNVVIATGNNNHIYYTLDGGYSWDDISSSEGGFTHLDASYPFLKGAAAAAIAATTSGYIVTVAVDGVRNSIINVSKISQNINSITTFESLIAAAADNGVVLSMDGKQWSTISVGYDTIITRKYSSSFTAIPSDTTDQITTDNVWTAAKIRSDISPAYLTSIKGQIVKHWTSLQMPYNGKSYDDVIEVHYASEISPVSTDELRVFYAKNVGPVIFQKFTAGQLRSQYYRVD